MDEEDNRKWPDLRSFLRHTGRAVALVWHTSPALCAFFALTTLGLGLLPGLLVYVGKQLVDAVVLACETHRQEAIRACFAWAALEGAVVIVHAVVRMASERAEWSLETLIGHRLATRILGKAQSLELAQLEDRKVAADLQKALTTGRHRAFYMVTRMLRCCSTALSLGSFAVIIWEFSPWALCLFALAAVPSFAMDVQSKSNVFRLEDHRTKDAQLRHYLTYLIVSRSSAPELRSFQLGPPFSRRVEQIFHKFYREDTGAAWRRAAMMLGSTVLSSAVLYAAYFWILWDTVSGRSSLGELTMLLAVFKQSQSQLSSLLTVVGQMVADNFHLTNLERVLSLPVAALANVHGRKGPNPAEGIRFEGVSFQYPGETRLALDNVSFQLRPGQTLALVGENGSGKTTLVKLLGRLYRPTGGRIWLDGLELEQWDEQALRARISVIFQEFVHYNLSLGENLGVGDVEHIDDETRVREAAEKSLVTQFLPTLPDGFATVLGGWWNKSHELSGGQWQRVALGRAFMRSNADILILDEPTAAVDPRAEALLFEQFRQTAGGRMAILISHRFCTVRHADSILVLEQGRLLESGTHQQLLEAKGLYAELFTLQAAGYQ